MSSESSADAATMMAPTDPVDPGAGHPAALVDAIGHHALLDANRIAIVDGATRITYRDLMRWACLLVPEIEVIADASAPIGVLLPPGFKYVVAVVALLMSGRTLVSMDSSSPDQRNRRIADHSGMAAVIVDADTASTVRRVLPELPQISVPPISRTSEHRSQPQARLRSVRNRLFAIVYTSGSTGEPKGVCKPTGNLLFRTQRTAASWGLTGEDRVPIFQPLSVSTSLSLALSTLYSGARIVFVDIRGLGLSEALRVLQTQGATVCALIPSVFRSLFGPDCSDGRSVASGIRLLQLSGEPLRHSDVDLYRRRFPETCRLWIVIGTAETGRYASWRIDHSTRLSDRPLIPVGYPPADMQLELIGADGRPVERGQVGEIVVAGRSLTSGYWRDPAWTDERFLRAGERPENVTYRTGDFGRLLPDGLLEFVGRRDRQVKVLGNTVHLTEVEAVIAACPGISEVSLVARPVTTGMRLIAYVVGDAPPVDIRAWCRERLSAPMRPAEFVIREQLPRLPNGKLDLVLLAQIDRERTRDGQPQQPPAVGTPAPVLEAVRVCWTHHLGADTLRADSRFEDAGGDSLKALELLQALERRMGRKLKADLVGPDCRPSELSARLNAIEPRDGAAGLDRGAPLLFVIPDYFAANFGFAKFTALLATGFKLQIIDHREGSPVMLGPIDRERYFATIERRIIDAGPPHRLWVLGYGAGCRIAAEAVRRLIARGIEVEFIGLVDGSTPAVSANRRVRVRQQQRPPFKDRVASSGGLIRFVTERLALRITTQLIDREAFGPLRWWVAALAGAGRRQVAAESVKLAFKRTRDAAFHELPGGPVPMPISVFTSTHDYPLANVAADRGWSRFSPAVRLIPVPGHRKSMLQGSGADAILATLLDTEARLRAKGSAAENSAWPR